MSMLLPLFIYISFCYILDMIIIKLHRKKCNPDNCKDKCYFNCLYCWKHKKGSDNNYY